MVISFSFPWSFLPPCPQVASLADSISSTPSIAGRRNINPPSYLYPEPKRRWDRYTDRIDHAAALIRESGASIVALQEIRHDDTFASPGAEGTAGSSQIRHLADRLPEYQYVYHPAMLYYDKGKPTARAEEGPGILSIFPILSSEVLLLSRDPNDKQDEHQRACLHAEILVPGWGIVDVFSVHLSLSEAARDRSVAAIKAHAAQCRGVAQILMGDLNAEPLERAMVALREPDTKNRGFRFKDAWLELYPELEPGSSDPATVRNLTFPSCNPTKRIDYIYIHGDGVRTASCDVIGQDPAEGPGIILRDGLGMLDLDTPTWASDHRAVVARLTRTK